MTTLIVANAGQGGLTPRQSRQFSRDQRRAEVAVLQHGLEAAALVAMSRQDAQATADANQASLDEELRLLDYGLSQANGSAAKIEIVTRKVLFQISLDERQVMRHFGR